MRVLLLVLTILVHSNSAISQEDTLSKYSYLIYGDISPTAVEKGTVSFVRYKGELYLLTAHHVLTGWNCNYHFQTKNYPKTMYVRVNSKTDNHYVFIPINIIPYTKKKYNFYYWEKPDICLLKINIPSTDTVNSIEKLMYKSNRAISDTVISYGYPIFNTKSKNEIITRKPEFGYGRIVTKTLAKVWTHQDSNVKDSINYILKLYNDSRLSAGYSGAPVFCKTNDGYSFCGIINGGTKEAAIIVKPQFIFDFIKNSKTLN